MKNGNIHEFLERLSYGEELQFEYDSKEYFLQGWLEEDNIHKMTMFEISEEPFNEYDWEYSCGSMQECAATFLSAPIWNGKTFIQIEQDVFWIE